MASAAGGVVNSFQATALLSSPTSDLYDSRSIALRVRMSLHLGDNNADDGGGGSFTCRSVKNRFGEKPPCPGPKGKMQIEPANAVPYGFPSPTGDGFLKRYVVTMLFDGGAECVADAYPTFSLGAAIDLAIPPSSTYIAQDGSGRLARS